MRLQSSERFNVHPHAAARAAERVPVAPEVLTAQVDGPRSPVFVGFSIGSNRVHVLTYASATDEFFVLICNMRTQTVVTVLTLAQYESRFGAVEEERKGKARRRALEASGDPDDAPIYRDRVYACCRLQEASGHVRTVSLGWLPLKEAGVRPSDLVQDPQFMAALRQLAAAKCIDLSAAVDIRVQKNRREASVALAASCKN